MRNLTDKASNRVNTKLENSIEQLENSIKAKQEMMKKLNEELENELKMKSDLESVQVMLFGEEL